MYEGGRSSPEAPRHALPQGFHCAETVSEYKGQSAETRVKGCNVLQSQTDAEYPSCSAPSPLSGRGRKHSCQSFSALQFALHSCCRLQLPVQL